MTMVPKIFIDDYDLAPSSDKEQEEEEMQEEYGSRSTSEGWSPTTWTNITAKWQEAGFSDTKRGQSSNLRTAAYVAVLVLVSLLVWFARGKYDIGSQTDRWSTSSARIAPPPRNAFITFLNEYYPNKNSPTEDIFFTNARMLAYQTLHDPATRASPSANISFVVAVTDNVPEWKRARLRADGAVVRQIDKIKPLGDGGMYMRWQDQFSKLEMFKLMEWDTLVYIDADTVLRGNMEGIFADQGARAAVPRNVSDARIAEEPELPADYLFASVDDLTGHGFERRSNSTRLTKRLKRWRYFSGGFWMFRPSLEMYMYLTSMITLAEGRFNPEFQEQNLLNYVFRPEGPMPWHYLDFSWNIWGPSERDWKMDIKSFHGHAWEHNRLEGMHNLWVDVRTRMEEVSGVVKEDVTLAIC